MLDARTLYESTLFANYKDNCKHAHLAFNHALSISSSISHLVSLGNFSATTPSDKAELLNEHFHSGYTTPTYSQPISIMPPTSPQSHICLERIFIEVNGVFSILSSSNSSKATGIDGIGPAVLKYCATSLCQPLSFLFQKCI